MNEELSVVNWLEVFSIMVKEVTKTGGEWGVGGTWGEETTDFQKMKSLED